MRKPLNESRIMTNELQMLINEFKREIESLKQMIEILEKRQQENEEEQIRIKYEKNRRELFEYYAKKIEEMNKQSLLV